MVDDRTSFIPGERTAMKLWMGTDTLVFAGLFGVSLAVPLWAWLSGSPPAIPEGDPGLGWLSMPVALVVRSPAWRGWELLSPERPGPVLRPPPLPVPAETCPPLPRLGYRGTLEMLGKRRYWFEDLGSGRCMALSAGEADPVSGLQLIEVKDGERALFRVEGRSVLLQVEWEGSRAR